MYTLRGYVPAGDCRELGRQINYEEVKAELEWGGRQHEGAGDISIFVSHYSGSKLPFSLYHIT